MSSQCKQELSNFIYTLWKRQKKKEEKNEVEQKS